MLGIGVLIIFLSIIGITYGYWMQTETQNTFDVLGVKCFELTMSNETKGIHLEEASPITDEEGKKQTGYTFTIKNTCNTSATYQVNLEEKALQDIKRLSDQYIKVSLNDSTGKNLNTYENTEATIKEEDFTSDKSHKLTSGSLGPDEEETYTLKLWMDYDTPPIEDVMNATFESKISVVATYIEEEKRNNTITIVYEEQNDYTKDKETVTFTATSEKEDINITEYSLDGASYNSLDKPSTHVTLPLDFTEEKEYNIYFKDAMGNKKEQEFETKMLDQTGPTIDVTETSNESGAVLNITFSDAKSGLKEYRIEDGVSSIDLEEEWIPFNEENQITLSYQENKTITIYGKDKVGNISTKEFTITKADTKGPDLTIHNPKANTWSNTSVTITLSATDDISGVDKFYYSTDDGDTKTWNEISDVEFNDKTGTATFKIEKEYNGKYYFKVKDKLGNESEVQETIVMIDLSTPSQNFELDNNSVKGDNNWYKSASITVTGTDTGGSNIVIGSYCEGTTNCEPDTPFNETTKNITLSDGTNRVVCVIFTDGAGNTSAKQCSTAYNVDGEAPTISDLTAPTTWGASNTLTAKVQDTISGIAGYLFSVNANTPTVEWTLDNNHPTSAQTYMGTANSNTKWYFYVKDQAGNVSSLSVTVDKVDNGLPSSEFKINSSTDGDNGWYKTKPTITVTATDEQSGVAKVESCTTTETSCTNYEDLTLDGNDGATSRKGTVTLPDGNGSKVCVKVTDGVGKTSTKCSEGYKVDSTPPTVGSVTGKLNGTSITFTASVTENGSGIKSSGYSFNIKEGSTSKGTFTSSTPTYTYTSGTEEHSYSATVTVTDNAGNVSTGVTSNSVKIPKLVFLAGMNVPLVETGDGLYEVDHSKEEGTTLAAEWKAKLEWRYAGSNPDNYVWFNCDKNYPKEGAEDNVSRCEKWRIIGLVNVQTKSGITQRLKIVKSSPVANAYWDNENNKNDWTKASLMKKLNEIDGTQGEYYQKLKDTAINMISDDIIWNIGGTRDYQSKENGLAKHFYGYERGTSTGSSNAYPNTWPAQGDETTIARVGLIYPSDYGYAVGGTKENRNTCLDKEMYNWSAVSGCKNNDWLKPSSGDTWTMSPISSNSSHAFYVYSGGYVIADRVNRNSDGVAPVVYLASNVKIADGHQGTAEDPYILEAE